MMTPELQSKISQWQLKATMGTLSIDEMREAITAMRQNRRDAGATTARKAKGPAKSSEDLLSELGNL